MYLQRAQHTKVRLVHVGIFTVQDKKRDFPFDQIRHFLLKFVKIISFLVIKSTILVAQPSEMIVVTPRNLNFICLKRSESLSNFSEIKPSILSYMRAL